MIVKYKHEFAAARANVGAFRDQNCWVEWSRALNSSPATEDAASLLFVSQ